MSAILGDATRAGLLKFEVLPGWLGSCIVDGENSLTYPRALVALPGVEGGPKSITPPATSGFGTELWYVICGELIDPRNASNTTTRGPGGFGFGIEPTRYRNWPAPT